MKTVYATLIKKVVLEKVRAGKANEVTEEEKKYLMKDVSFEAPDYVIGVGIISMIDNYLKENNLYDTYEMTYYSESKN